MILILIAHSSILFGSQVTSKAITRAKARLLLLGMLAPLLASHSRLAPSSIHHYYLCLLDSQSVLPGYC
jgi:hypothetical protein